jgi:hypothetical protein
MTVIIACAAMAGIALAFVWAAVKVGAAADREQYLDDYTDFRSDDLSDYQSNRPPMPAEAATEVSYDYTRGSRNAQP